MTVARPYNSHPFAAMLMFSGVGIRPLTWSALEEFAGDLDRMEAEDAWQAKLLNAVEAEDEP